MEHNQNIPRKIAVIVTFTVAIVGAVYLFYSMRLRSKASNAMPKLSFATNPSPLVASSNFDLIVKMNPNGTTGFYAVSFVFTYQADKISFQNTQNLDANIVVLDSLLTVTEKKVDTAAHTIKIVGTRTGTAYSGSTDMDVAKVTMKMKTGAVFPAFFQWINPTGLGSAGTAIEKTDGTFSDVAAGSSSSSTAAGTGNIHFGTTYPVYARGTTFVLDVLVSTGGEQVKSADIIFTYDNTRIVPQYTTGDVSANIQIQPDSGFSQTLSTKSVDLAAKTMTAHLVANTSNGSPVPVQGTDIKVIKVPFTVKTDAPLGDMTFSTDAASAITSMLNRNILSSKPSYSVSVIMPASSSSSANGGGGEPEPPDTVGNGDSLNINSTPLDPNPYRYEQYLKLEKGTYTLSAIIKPYIIKGRGILVTFACGESTCGGGRKLHDIMGKTPLFTTVGQYQEQSATVTVPDDGDNKKYAVRVFVEDGSEAEVDKVSLLDRGATEKLLNDHYPIGSRLSFPRKQPASWEFDIMGNIYGTILTDKGTSGALFINSSSLK